MAAALVAAIAGATATESAAQPAPKIRNVIVMIADGAGYNILEATRLWTGKPLAQDDSAFLKAALSVHGLADRNDAVPGPDGLAQDEGVAYSPARGWDAAPPPADYACPKDKPVGFAGYGWHCRTSPDSANTMSAMMTGVKTYNNAINVDGRGTPLLSAAEAAVASGRLAGVVTTAQLSDATSAAGGGAHAVSRYFRTGIADEMFGRGLLSVIAGAGNPDFDNDAQPRTPPRHDWIGAALWADLKAGTNASRANPGWTLIQDRAAVQAIAERRVAPPQRLAIVARADNGIQQYRGELKPGSEAPFATPLLDAQPSLAEITGAALARLGRQPFFLVIEESNTDRAAHANNLGRVIEAGMSFDESLRAVIAWVDRADTAASWDNTLLIVTADHDHLLFGPDAERIAFQPVQPDGPDADRLPDHKWFSNSHSNQLVPVFVRGAGGRELMRLARRQDRHCPAAQACVGRGRYLDQTDIGRFLLGAMQRRP